jgi:hypothetical protein
MPDVRVPATAQEWTPPLRSPQRRPPPDPADASVGATAGSVLTGSTVDLRAGALVPSDSLVGVRGCDVLVRCRCVRQPISDGTRERAM